MVDIHTTGPRESPFDHNSIKDGPIKSSLYQNRINNTTNIEIEIEIEIVFIILKSTQNFSKRESRYRT